MIPLLKPSCSDLEIKYVTEVLRSGWWGLGPKVEEFERKFASFVGAKYAVAVNSATTALDLALKVHDVKDGEVIVPALTFISTALVALYNNNKVVFCDIDEKTLCVDWKDIQKKITKNTKAIIPVHYGGHFAGDYQLQPLVPTAHPIVIEDAAHAAGNSMVGKRHTTCWSFHAVKNIATGDGGMITTNDENIYKKLMSLRWCGIDKTTWERSEKRYGWDYQVTSIGYKAHMNDITAAIGLAQLERIGELNMRRKLRVLEYLHALSSLTWLQLPEYDEKSNWHMFVVRMDNRNAFIDYMLSQGISVGVHYKPLTHYDIFPNTELPVTDNVWKTLVTLPLYPDMTDDEFSYIVKTIKIYK